MCMHDMKMGVKWSQGLKGGGMRDNAEGKGALEDYVQFLLL